MNNWWTNKPRKINVVVDNDSWILPFACTLVEKINILGDKASIVRHHDQIVESDISFYLGCVKITPSNILTKSIKNLVVHASNLPEGRGFSPLTWQILEGKSQIPVCLFEMVDEVDAGPIIFKENITLKGNELLNELRELLGNKTIELCLNYITSESMPMGTPQKGSSTHYPRRRPLDSQIDTSLSIDSLFNLFRVVDNDQYPAFFKKNGKKYILKIMQEEDK